MKYGIGIDLGGTNVKMVVVHPDGELVQQTQFRFDQDRPMDWASGIKEQVKAISVRQEGCPEFVGLSAPGLTAEDGASIAHMPGRLKGLEGLNWSEFLGLKLPVPVLNDAHSALMGELWQGVAKGFQNAILLTLGTGVGGAAMVNGHLLLGEIRRAGHLGHSSLYSEGTTDIAGTPGSLEDAIGNCTLERRSLGKFTSTKQLVEAARNGDYFAMKVWLKSVWDLSCALTSFINILDPQGIIIGGGIARADDWLFDPLKQFLATTEWRAGGHQVELLHAQLGEFAGAFGAAYNALRLETEGENR
ncbi:MAG TPA: ROK family protein [Verrucomicrobiales bacterium]|nr:ROK family protein [Verrucomicrobiales bacterium]